ncbi:MAG: hypothetical protein ABTQ34_06300 [Bdellovibrionales bacterium]
MQKNLTRADSSLDDCFGARLAVRKNKAVLAQNALTTYDPHDD